MTPAQLSQWRRRVDCLLADPRPDRQALTHLFAEMQLALVACHEREERLIAQAALRVVATERLGDTPGIEDRLPRGRTTLPPDGIGGLLTRKERP